jgi:hypothetical protein
MIVCCHCKEEISSDIKVFFSHLKSIHGINDRNGRYTCSQRRCNRTFGNKFAFARHIESNHADAIKHQSMQGVDRSKNATVDNVLPTVSVEDNADILT